MRPLAALLLLLGLAAGAHAQQQEQKLVDRILKPDLSLGSSWQNVAFYPGKGGFDSSTTASVKDFSFIQKFFPKSFETREFDSKNFWQGDFKFTTRVAETKTDAAVERTYVTKTMPVRDARESGKDYGTREYATKEAVPVGKTSQAKLNENYLGRGPMSMDQVRELLNKNK